jgi:hypothetical protein
MSPFINLMICQVLELPYAERQKARKTDIGNHMEEF